jgi:hypothetical protein
MNLVLLLISAQVWRAAPVDAFARVTIAIALLSIEMQAVTLLGAGTLRSLSLLNLVLGGVWLVASPSPRARSVSRPARGTALPWPTIGALAGVALLLATRPLAGADPYHLDRVAQIQRLGTLEYDVAADIKVNVLASSYELLLADLAQVPWTGGWLLRAHGLFSLAYFTLGVAAVRQWLPGGPPWCWSAVFVVPVVFHQLAFVKNDLYSATPAFVALAWTVARARDAPVREVAGAAALAGVAVAMKWVAFPVAGVMIAWMLWHRARDGSALAALAIGGLSGAVAGGLAFTLAQTARWYGHPFEPLAALGNRTTSVGEAATSVARFAISLVDFGALTRSWWPGRGGWGATFGATLIWALVVAVARWKSAAAIRGAAVASACSFVAFAAVYPDADVAHRLVLAPGLLLIAAAAQQTDGDDARATWLRRLLAAALVLSAAQIARSLSLYLA